MPRIKVGSKRQKYTVEKVKHMIYTIVHPPGWRNGQFVFNMASAIFGDDLVRSIGYDPFYNDENIEPFIEKLTEALNNRKV